MYILEASSAEPDQTPLSLVSDLVLHCFKMSHEKEARLKWFNCHVCHHILMDVNNICHNMLGLKVM